MEELPAARSDDVWKGHLLKAILHDLFESLGPRCGKEVAENDKPISIVLLGWVVVNAQAK